MLGEETTYERTMGDDFKPACAHGFERAGDQPRREPVAAACGSTSVFVNVMTLPASR